MEHEGARLPDLRDRIRDDVTAPGYHAVTRTLARLAPPDTDAEAHAALLLTALTGLRRTSWTFGPDTYRLGDDRALDAWIQQCIAVLRPTSGRAIADHRKATPEVAG